jgi:hypothetical protein
MTEQGADRGNEEFHRDRRAHGGEIDRLDEDQLARLAEEERAEAGVDDYDQDEVPPATDAPADPDLTQGEVYQEASAEIRRELDEGDLRRRGDRDPYPPSHYDRS